MLAQAAEADARGKKEPAEQRHWTAEAARLRGLAGSAVWHAEANAADAGYTDDIQTLARDGRFYVAGTNPATGDRLVWNAGVYARPAKVADDGGATHGQAGAKGAKPGCQGEAAPAPTGAAGSSLK